MVFKITKKSPKKPTNPSPNYRRTRHRRKPSPLSSITAATTVFTASLRSCRRRLIKIFTHIPIIGTPRKHGFRRLKSLTDDSETTHKILPPPSPTHKKTAFLDLDETLVHSKTGEPPERYDFTVHPVIDGQILTFYVLKRPGVEELLKGISKFYEVVVFTAGLREYASLVLDNLDPMGDMISHRLYRDSCREMEGRYVKDLAGTGRALDRAVIVDDNPNSYLFQPANGIPVKPFVGNLEDRELERVMKFFEGAVLFEDMRDAVLQYLSDNGIQKSQV